MRSFVALNLAFSIVLDDATDADSDGNALSIVFDESTNTDREDIVFLFCEKCGVPHFTSYVLMVFADREDNEDI